MADNKQQKPVKKREARTPEFKAAKFKEIASNRVSKALRAINLIGNLASPNYVYTPEQTARIFAALKGAVAETEARFAAPGGKPESKFTL